jgi:hypothetical protein
MQLSSLPDHGDVIGLDKEIEALRMSDHTRKVASDAEALPLPDSTFDSIWACAMAQWTEW